MSNLMIAIMATLAYFLTYGGNWLFGQCMIERPIVVGMVTGLFLGDMKTGITIGAALEAIYMGAVNIGGATSAEPVSATVMSVTFAITAGLSFEQAVTLAVPVGLIFNSLGKIFILVSNFFAPAYLKICERGDGKALTRLILAAWFTMYAIRSVIIFCCIYMGVDAVQLFIAAIPERIMNGLNVSAGMLAAIGMAMLMKMLISKENIVFFFLGFVLYTYLNLPAIPIAIIAIVLAVVIGVIDKSILDTKALAVKGGAAGVSEEEEFFG